MKKAKYVSEPFSFMLLILLPLIGSIILLILKEYYGIILFMSVALIFGVILIVLRKKFFLKMKIDEQGFTTFYRGKVVKQLRWEDINYAIAVPTAQGGQITFSDTPFYTGKNKWKNLDKIFVNIRSCFALELYKYKDKILVPIKDLEKLPKRIQENLTTNKKEPNV